MPSDVIRLQSATLARCADAVRVDLSSDRAIRLTLNNLWVRLIEIYKMSNDVFGLVCNEKRFGINFIDQRVAR